jgi:NAD(P)-dependent dehydrogenase (short-subunit alcohol dehydrogenase family)
MDLSGKLALVTGGTYRVGRYLSLALAKAGADVVVNYWKTPREAEETKQYIENLGRKCLTIEANIADISENQSMIDIIEEKFGRLDILVHNAGNFNQAPFFEINEKMWDSSMNLILKGPFFLSQRAAKLMLKNGFGKMIAIIGNSYFENWPDFIPHTVAKTAMAKLMQSMAIALSPTIQCVAICPSTVLTGEDGKDEAQRAARGETGSVNDQNSTTYIERGITMHRGNPEELAELVVYLSGCSRFLNGNVIALDGGKTIL